MSKETQKRLVPELRFSEFEKSLEWNEIPLGKIGKVSMCKRILKEETKAKGDIPFYKIGTFGKQADAYIDKDIFEAYRKKYSYPSKGEILISASGTIGRLVVFDGEDSYFQDSNIVWINNNERLVTNKFLFYCYSNIKWATDDNTIARLYNNNLRGMKIVIPSISEQQKIADCLSALDELINAHTQKHEELLSYKKGLMQNLFPSKGKTVPALRFHEFKNEEDWCETRLIDVADKKVKWSFIGGPFGSNLKSSDYAAKGIRIIQLQNIGDGEFKDDYKIFTTEEKANELLSNNIYPGDIILSKMGDPVGRACLIPEIHPRYVMCSDGIRLVINKEKFNKYFIYLLINSDWFRALVEKTATGSTRKRIGLDDLKKLPLIVPKLEEQQKIADCLFSIDEAIAAQAEKIENLNGHKKGLMQQLFPAIDEDAA